MRFSMSRVSSNRGVYVWEYDGFDRFPLGQAISTAFPGLCVLTLSNMSFLPGPSADSGDKSGDCGALPSPRLEKGTGEPWEWNLRGKTKQSLKTGKRPTKAPPTRSLPAPRGAERRTRVPDPDPEAGLGAPGRSDGAQSRAATPRPRDRAGRAPPLPHAQGPGKEEGEAPRLPGCLGPRSGPLGPRSHARRPRRVPTFTPARRARSPRGANAGRCPRLPAAPQPRPAALTEPQRRRQHRPQTAPAVWGRNHRPGPRGRSHRPPL